MDEQVIWPIFVCHLQMWKLASNVVNGDFNTKETDVINVNASHRIGTFSTSNVWNCHEGGLKAIYLL